MWSVEEEREMFALKIFVIKPTITFDIKSIYPRKYSPRIVSITSDKYGPFFKSALWRAQTLNAEYCDLTYSDKRVKSGSFLQIFSKRKPTNIVWKNSHRSAYLIWWCPMSYLPSQLRWLEGICIGTYWCFAAIASFVMVNKHIVSPPYMLLERKH